MRTLQTILLFLSLNVIAFGQKRYFDTILVNNKSSFKIKIEKKLSLLTSTLKGITTVIDSIEVDAIAYTEYPDFNEDGNKDILIGYFGNYDTYFLYLFDKTTNKFIKIKDFEDFPNSVQLKSNPKYYYSYHRAGCADYNWESDLFKIENFKIVHLGNIEGKGCDIEVKVKPQVIDIYKVPKNNESNKKLVEKLPYLKHIKKYNQKWTFIEKYWNKNYAKFE